VSCGLSANIEKKTREGGRRGVSVLSPACFSLSECSMKIKRTCLAIWLKTRRRRKDGN
jgi:hypothetical protein